MESLKKVIGNDQAGKILSDSILKILSRYGNNDGPLHFVHHQKIREFVRKGECLQLILPAFPAKSPNREKSIGPLPDLAEVLGLERLQLICEEISALYSPGAKILICSDGRIFSDLVGVSDEEITAYRCGIEEIIESRGLSHLSTFHLEDAFPGLEFFAMRMAVMREFGPSLEALKMQAKVCPHTQAMVNGIHRFLVEDQSPIQPGQSRNQLRKATRPKAYEVVQRSKSWSAFVEASFPAAIRLSIHPQASGSKKIGIRLLGAKDRWATPWHNAAFFDGTDFCLMPKKEAEKRGKLRFAEGKFAYFHSEAI